MRNHRKHVQYLSSHMALAGMQSASETHHKTLPGKDALAAGRWINSRILMIVVTLTMVVVMDGVVVRMTM